MATLHQHLQLQDPEHDRLEFRADCPHCRGRLAGRYPSAHLLSRRAEATLATGAVLAGSLLPAAGAAADLNVNADDTHAKVRINPPAVVVDNGDQGGGRGGPQSVHGGGSTTSSPAPAPAHTPDVTVDVPPARSPAPAPPARREPAPAPTPPSTPAAPSSHSPPQAQVQAPAPGLGLGPKVTAPHAAPPGSRPSPTLTPKDAGSIITARIGYDAASSDGGAPPGRHGASKSAAGARDEHAGQAMSKPGVRGTSSDRATSRPAQDPSTHVVRLGESLWVIAEQRLGAQASDAEIATAVERLWQLNAQRIGTGNPDLIYPGQTLQVP